MRRLAVAVAVAAMVATVFVLTPLPGALAQSQMLDRAAESLRRDPVYVDPAAERAIDGGAADRLRQRIRNRGGGVFVAVLPGSAAAEVGADAARLPAELQRRVGLAGTYAVVAGNAFRAGSTNLRSGQAGAAATAAFQARSGDGTEAVLADFVDRVAALQRGSSGAADPGGSGEDTGGSGSGGGSRSSGGGLGLLPVLLLVGAVVGAIFLWRRSKQQRERERVTTEAEMSEDRDLLRAELSVLAEDVMRLEPQIALHPDAAADYEAGVSRYRVAQAALDAADDPIDLVRVRRVMDEGQYAMSRARAIIEGREPPPPPADLTRRGRHDEPPVDLDDRGRPQYAGYDAPFYGGGGGWFGGGGGLLTGLFLGQMLGGWGGGHQTVYVDQGDGGGGDAGDASAGDWGGGGDWGDFGGGDFGGGDVGGGDW